VGGGNKLNRKPVPDSIRFDCRDGDRRHVMTYVVWRAAEATDPIAKDDLERVVTGAAQQSDAHPIRWNERRSAREERALTDEP
jgi:hypothetical protein